MKPNNGNLPAFPAVVEEAIGKCGKETHYGDVKYPGLSKREQFAMAAMQGLLNQPIDALASGCRDAGMPLGQYVTGMAVEFAELLLIELEKVK